MISPVVPLLILIAPFSVNRFPNKLEPNGANTILRNLPFCSFALSLVVSLTPFINKPYSSRILFILMIRLISSFEIISVVLFIQTLSYK